MRERKISPEMDTLYRWIVASSPAATKIDWDTDLIETRIVSSLGIVEMLILLEELTGLSQDHLRSNIGALRSLASIERSFFAQTI